MRDDTEYKGYLTVIDIEYFYKQNKDIVDGMQYTEGLFDDNPGRLYTLLQFGVKAAAANLDIVTFADCLSDLTRSYDELPSYDIDDLIECGWIKKDRYDVNIKQQIRSILSQPDYNIKQLSTKNIYDIIWNIGLFDRYWIHGRSEINNTLDISIISLYALVNYFSTQNTKYIDLKETIAVVNDRDFNMIHYGLSYSKTRYKLYMHTVKNKSDIQSSLQI